MQNLAPNLSLEIQKEKKAIRDAYGIALENQAENFPNLIVLSADLRESMKVDTFQKKFPDRFIECGVAEQNMVGIAAGLGLSGNIAVTTSFAVFSPGRTWDQIRVSVCYSNSNVKIIGGHSGLLTGKDGATHQALEDIAITRVLPNMIVINPCDYFQAIKAMEFGINQYGPVYLRGYREKTIQITTNQTPLEIGEPQIFKEGKDLTIISSGPIISEVLDTIYELENTQNLSIELINLPFIKPLNAEKIISSLHKTKKGIVIEEHQIFGGVGSSVLEKISDKVFYPIKLIGINDTFGESGDYKELYEKYEISSRHQVSKILQFLKRVS